MNDEVGSATVLLVGALLVRLSVGGAYARYVRVGMGPWLLVAGILLALLGLGSFGVDRSTVAVTSGGRTFAPLPEGATVPMTLLEFDERAADHDGASFGSTPVLLTGFVAQASDGNGFRLARYQIACCAADAV